LDCRGYTTGKLGRHREAFVQKAAEARGMDLDPRRKHVDGYPAARELGPQISCGWSHRASSSSIGGVG
jgi:hypothetical protein